MKQEKTNNCTPARMQIDYFEKELIKFMPAVYTFNLFDTLNYHAFVVITKKLISNYTFSISVLFIFRHENSGERLIGFLVLP